MKIKLYTLLIIVLTTTITYSEESELVIRFTENNTDYKFGLTLNTSTYFWNFNDDLKTIYLGDNSAYPDAYYSRNEVRFDTPKGQESYNDVMPWALMNIGLGFTGGGVNFYIDFRDEKWATDRDNYSVHDMHIQIDYTTKIVYYRIVGIEEDELIEINNGDTLLVWDIWRNNTAYQKNFTQPVTMKNRVEGQSYNFGQLVGNGEDINSGSIGNLIAAGPGPIKHKTLDEIYNSDRYYSFKWEYDIITPVEDQNPYNSTNYVIVPFNSAPKDVTRKFRKVYPLTIKNILPEIGGITTGNILFKDPTTTNQFETKSAAGSGYINNEAFNNLNETINNEPNQQYSVKANSIIPYNNRDYNWYAGDFNPTTDTDFQINNGQKNLNAYYKGSQISNNAEAFSNNGQRKFVRTDNGNLHMVYESIGYVWYEKSTDNGATWTIANGGKPVSNTEAKSPSLDHYGNSIGIVFQEKNGNASKIKLAFFDNWGNQISLHDEFNNLLVENIVRNEPLDNYSIDLQPVIGWGSEGKFTVVWKSRDTEYEFALAYRLGAIEGDEQTWHTPDDRLSKIPNTDATSANPTISVKKTANNPVEFHIVWDQQTSFDNRHIKYDKLKVNSDNTIAVGNDYYEPSSYNYASGYGPFSINVNPSIDLNGGSVQVVWIGRKTYNNENRIVKKQFSGYWYSSFNYFDQAWELYNLTSPTVAYADDGSYAVAWGNRNNTNRYWRNEQIRTFNTSGEFLQLSSAATNNDMRALSFNETALPYQFNLTNATTLTVSRGLEKTNSIISHMGREGIIAKDTCAFSFAFGDILLDGEEVNFVNMGEDSIISNAAELSSYLETEPFTLTNNSDFLFSISYGVIDSINALTILKDEDYVNFKVELFDKITEEVIGTFNNVTFSKNNLTGQTSISYSVNTDNIGEKSVRLRLKITDNLNGSYNLAQIYAQDDVFGKTTTPVETSFTGESPVEEYSLAQNYPNPFNPSTTIKYQIPSDGNVSLKIYDVLGAEVMTLVNTAQAQGKYEVSFDASQLSSGVYIYRIQSNDYVASRKMMLLK